MLNEEERVDVFKDEGRRVDMFKDEGRRVDMFKDEERQLVTVRNPMRNESRLPQPPGVLRSARLHTSHALILGRPCALRQYVSDTLSTYVCMCSCDVLMNLVLLLCMLRISSPPMYVHACYI